MTSANPHTVDDWKRIKQDPTDEDLGYDLGRVGAFERASERIDGTEMVMYELGASDAWIESTVWYTFERPAGE